tara:strand:- start:18 stop:473 length:456 start_codon:yes stop_codon:yes gene_type:complete
MSIREDIAANIVQALQGITDPNVVLVSRNPINISDLSIAQYPAIIVRSADEDREDAGFGPTAGLRISNINYIIHGYVRAESSATSVNNNIDTQKNKLIEAIEEKLEEDRKRNSLAMNSFVSNITSDDTQAYPLGKVDITYTVQYKYTRGTN